MFSCRWIHSPLEESSCRMWIPRLALLMSYIIIISVCICLGGRQVRGLESRPKFASSETRNPLAVGPWFIFILAIRSSCFLLHW